MNLQLIPTRQRQNDQEFKIILIISQAGGQPELHLRTETLWSCTTWPRTFSHLSLYESFWGLDSPKQNRAQGIWKSIYLFAHAADTRNMEVHLLVCTHSRHNHVSERPRAEGNCHYHSLCKQRTKNYLVSFGVKNHLRGWKDGSVVKSIACSSKSPEFNSRQPHSSSQPSVMGV